MMLPPEIAELVIEAFRALFVFAVPLVLAVTVASLFATALQSVTSIHEPAFGYAARVLALLVTLYFVFPPFLQMLMNVTALALQ